MSQVNGNYFNSIDTFLCMMHHQVLLGMPWCDLQGCWVLNTNYLFTLFFLYTDFTESAMISLLKITVFTISVSDFVCVCVQTVMHLDVVK